MKTFYTILITLFTTSAVENFVLRYNIVDKILDYVKAAYHKLF